MENETIKTTVEIVGHGIEYINHIRCIGLGTCLTILSGIAIIGEAVKRGIVEPNPIYRKYKE